MTVEQALNLKQGDRVFWNDPDAEAETNCSGWLKIDSIRATLFENETLFVIQSGDTGYHNIRASELSLTAPDGWGEKQADEDIDPRVRALMAFLDCDEWQVSEAQYTDNAFEVSDETYLVLTDGEADVAWEQELGRYIDECILPEMPEHLRPYFNEDAWKHDARGDGRAHSLATYDGDENEAEIDGEVYYIYRIG